MHLSIYLLFLHSYLIMMKESNRFQKRVKWKEMNNN